MSKDKEFMSTVPSSIELPEVLEWGNQTHVHQKDGFFSFSIEDFILALENSSEFHDNPTYETMEKVCQELVSESIRNFRKESTYCIRHVLPQFLKEEFK